MDYYSTLGVPKNATKEEIKKAYRKLAHQFHPDKQGGDEKKFKEINEAYQILGDENKRSQYDRFGSTFDRAGGGQSGFEGFDFGGFSGFGRGFNSRNFEFDLGDVFSDFFGGRASHAGTKTRQRGIDIQVDIQITLEDAFKGLEKEISLKKYVTCERCAGNKNEPDSSFKSCMKCGGSGEIRREQKTFLGSFSAVSVCNECLGEGRIPEKKCSKCRGAGRVQDVENIRVRIPAGINSDEAIRFSGKGEMGNGDAGDLYVRVRVKDHAKFERRDADIYSDESISVTQASLGDKIRVETLDGVHEVGIPAGFQTGGMVRLSGKGMPRMVRNGRGDHYVRISVKTPERLSKRQKELFEELRKEGM